MKGRKKENQRKMKKINHKLSKKNQKNDREAT